MPNAATILSLTLLALGAAGPALAGGSALCRPGEIPVFACRFKGHELALCGSNPYSATTGYLQYRSLRGGKLDLVFPAQPGPAGRTFLFSRRSYSGGGQYHIRFASGGFDYYLFNLSTSEPSGDGVHRDHFDMDGVVVRQGERRVSQRVCDDDRTSNIDYRVYTNLAEETFDEGVVRFPER
jgi:hypothetical protein